MNTTTKEFATATVDDASRFSLPQRWMTYLKLQEDQKVDFLDLLRRTVLEETNQGYVPDVGDSTFVAYVSNRVVRDAIFSLVQKQTRGSVTPNFQAVLDQFLSAGIPIDICDLKTWTTSLHKAAYSYLPEEGISLAAVLLDKGADINVRDRDNQTALHIAVKHSKGVKLVSYLVERGANINDDGDIFGFSPLSAAVRRAISAAVKRGICAKDDPSSFLDALETVKFLANHPDLDMAMPKNTTVPLEEIQRCIGESGIDDVKFRLFDLQKVVQRADEEVGRGRVFSL